MMLHQRNADSDDCINIPSFCFHGRADQKPGKGSTRFAAKRDARKCILNDDFRALDGEILPVKHLHVRFQSREISTTKLCVMTNI